MEYNYSVYSIIVSKLSEVNTLNLGFLFFFFLHRVKQMSNVRKLNVKDKQIERVKHKYKIKIVQHEYEVRSCCRDF